MIQLAEIFQDNMTLQRRKPIRIWGVSDVKQNFTVVLNQNIIFDDCDEMIQWKEEKSEDGVKYSFTFYLPAQEAAESVELEIQGKNGDSITLSNVDIGEVWIAGGQSNMEFMLKYDAESDEVISAANDPHYRFYNVGRFCFEGEREENLKLLADHWDRWVSYEPEEAPYISAVGTYFALQLRKKLQVPVAVVGCNWGGTSASCWVPEEDLTNDPELKVYIKEYEEALVKIKDLDKYIEKDYQYRKNTNTEEGQKQGDQIMKIEATAPTPLYMKALGKLWGNMHPMGPHHEWRPSGVYHTMQQKIAGFTCQGVIWYQGCSDDIHPQMYARLLTTVIRRWRKDWKDKLPFLFVQLAPFEQWQSCQGKYYPILRSQQQRVADHEPGCYMASIMDAGSRFDIHPKKKRQPGERLALLALNNVYGQKDIICQAPSISKIEYKTAEGTSHSAKLVISFDNAGKKLVLEQSTSSFSGLDYLFRLWVDGKKVPFWAEVSGNKVFLYSKALLDAEDIRLSFANMAYCEMNLKSDAGLPARPMTKVRVAK